LPPPAYWLWSAEIPEKAMAEFEGPWSSLPPPPPAPRKPGPGRLVRWLVLLAAAAAALVLLALFLPRQVSDYDWPWVLGLFGCLAIAARGLVAARSLKLSTTARYIALWAAIFAVGVGLYVFRGDLISAGLRVRSALVPGYAVADGARSMVISRAEDNAFYVMGEVDGAPVRFLIDTGATDIVLSPDDAARVGLAGAATRYAIPSETAGGVAFGAKATIDSLTVGSIRLTDVPCYINQQPMRTSLLGMPFLKRLDSFEVRGDQLFLRGGA
jgi:aspartyl protease family protein